MEVEVRNRGIFTERVSGVAIDFPGVSVRGASLAPEALASFDSGQLVLEVTFDCDALVSDGTLAFRGNPFADESAAAWITSERPWGMVGGDLSRKDDLGWFLQSAGQAACETP